MLRNITLSGMGIVLFVLYVCDGVNKSMISLAVLPIMFSGKKKRPEIYSIPIQIINVREKLCSLEKDLNYHCGNLEFLQRQSQDKVMQSRIRGKKQRIEK